MSIVAALWPDAPGEPAYDLSEAKLAAQRRLLGQRDRIVIDRAPNSTDPGHGDIAHSTDRGETTTGR
jgi:hypothetical protein